MKKKVLVIAFTTPSGEFRNIYVKPELNGEHIIGNARYTI